MTEKKLEEIAEHANNSLCKLERQLEIYMKESERDINLDTIYLISDYIGMGLLSDERLKVFKQRLGKVMEYQSNRLRTVDMQGIDSITRTEDYKFQVLKGLNAALNLYLMSQEELHEDSEAGQ